MSSPSLTGGSLYGILVLGILVWNSRILRFFVGILVGILV